uniref:Uncharacterized protein n=1 Tax=Ficedula albicollis TaxID=59894 RepID=A0A803VE49_FICAL
SAWTIPCYRLEKGRKGRDAFTCLSKDFQNFVTGLRKAAKDERALWRRGDQAPPLRGAGSLDSLLPYFLLLGVAWVFHIFSRYNPITENSSVEKTFAVLHGNSVNQACSLQTE